MRFEELAYRADGLAVTVPFHRKLTVVSGLSRASRQQWVDRVMGVLQGTAAGAGAGLVFVDGSGNRVRLVRDLRGGASITDLENGEDLADELPDGSRIDWFTLLGLDGTAATSLMLLDSSALEHDEEAEDGPAGGASAELAEARDVLARVEAEYQEAFARHRQLDELRDRLAEVDEQIRNFDEEVARRRHGQAMRAVQRLEAELSLLTGAEPEERMTAEAAVAAAKAGEEWHSAVAALERARREFGQRRRLDEKALQHALSLPTEVPPGLDELQSAYLDASERRSRLMAALRDGAASELPAPSAPWIVSLARADHKELWARAERVRAARSRAAELSMGLGGTGQQRDLVKELEEAHQAVEEAEREVAAARIPRLATAARRRLAKAQEREHNILTQCGFVSWLAFQMRRIDVLLEPDALEALRVAELEAQVALAAWHEIAHDVDPDEALNRRDEIERYAIEMVVAESSVETTEALRRELAEEAEPAYQEARRRLLEVCGQFDVEPEYAASEVAAIVEEARDARAQEKLEAAEATHRAAESHLEALLTRAGFPGPATISGRLAAVVAKAAEAAVHLEKPTTTRSVEEVQAELDRARAALGHLSRPDWDSAPLITDAPLPDSETLLGERSRLVEESERGERALPDLGRLSDRREALQRRVAILEASLGDGSRLLSFEEAEMVLLGRFAQARRVGPEAEPVPIVVDDALAGFLRHDKWRLLDLLARLGEASQVVYLTDDGETVDWASSRAREGSAALVTPGAVASVA